MAPKRDQSKGPTITVLGLSKMTPSLLVDLARRGFVSADDVRAPPTGETIAHPRTDEVIVFSDLFTAGLRMPLDPVVVDIFCLFKVYLHQILSTCGCRKPAAFLQVPKVLPVPSGCIISRRGFLYNQPEVRRYRLFPNMVAIPSPSTRTFHVQSLRARTSGPTIGHPTGSITR